MQKVPASYNLYTMQGNSLDLHFRFKAMDQGGSVGVVPVVGDIVFTAITPGYSLVRSMPMNASLQAARLSISARETRNFPIGRTRFEIEQKGGAQQQTLIRGFLYVSRGENTDD